VGQIPTEQRRPYYQNRDRKRDSVDIKKAIAKADSIAKAQKKKVTPPAIPEFLPNLENLEDRTERLTLTSAQIGDAKLSKDGEKLYYLARYDKGFNLWVLTHAQRNQDISRAKLGWRLARNE